MSSLSGPRLPLRRTGAFATSPEYDDLYILAEKLAQNLPDEAVTESCLSWGGIPFGIAPDRWATVMQLCQRFAVAHGLPGGIAYGMDLSNGEFVADLVQ